MRFILKAAAIANIVALSSGAVAQPVPEPGLVPSGTSPSTPGPAAYFTGQVTVRPLVSPQRPGRTSVGAVTFAPGARSHWHTHPAGQALVVTEGCGWTQREGGLVTRMCRGDTVYVPAGVKHWHGATASSEITHLAITETIDGKNVHWLEPVTDAQYDHGLRISG